MGAVVEFLQRVWPQRAQPAPARGGSSLFSEQATDQFMRWVTSVADPDEVLKKAGITRTSLRALTNDDEITAALDTRREALLGTPWLLEAEERKSPEEPTEFIRMQLMPHMEKVLRSCMESLPYGYSVQEVIYANVIDAKGNRRIGLGEVTEKPFEWFIPRLDGTVLYKSLQVPQGEKTDPRKFLLTARAQTYRNPYGEALFSRLYWPWLFRTNGWKFWVKWLERFGSPLIIGETAGDAKMMTLALREAANSATISVGAGDKVSVTQAQGNGEQFAHFERAVVSRYQRVILGQTLTSDAGGSDGKSGSYALGQVHNDVRMDRRNADIRTCESTVQKLIDVLWTLNAFDGQAPEFVLQDDTGLESERADRDVKLKNAGVRFTKQYFLNKYDLDDGDIDDKIYDPVMEHILANERIASGKTNDKPTKEKSPNANGSPKKQDEKPTPATKSNKLMIFDAQRRAFTPDQQVIEEALAEAMQHVESPIANDAIRDAIMSAKTPDDLSRKLAALMADSSLEEFRDVLGRALYVADIIGYIHAGNE